MPTAEAARATASSTNQAPSIERHSDSVASASATAIPGIEAMKPSAAILLMILGAIVAYNCLKELFGKEAGSMPDEEPEWSEMGKAEYGRAAAAEAPADAEAAKA